MASLKKIKNRSGKPMLPAREAARRLECVPDYISKLCREGRLKGKLSGQQWFVDPDSLSAFKAEREAARGARAEELSKLRKQELSDNGFAPKAPTWRASSFAKVAVMCAAAGLVLVGSVALGRTALKQNSQPLTAALAQVQSPFFGAQPPATLSPGSIFKGLLSFFAPPASRAPEVQQPGVINNYTTNNYNNYTTTNNNTTNKTEYQVSTTQGVTQSSLSEGLNQLRSEIYSQLNTPTGPLPSSGGVVNNIALSQHIDNLSGVTIHNSTISGSTIEGYLPTSGGSISGDLAVSGSLTLSGTTGCSLQTDANGVVACGSGGGGGTDGNWSFFNNSGIKLATTTNQVLVGAASTSTLSKLEVHGGATIDSATTTSATSTNFFTSNFTSSSSTLSSFTFGAATGTSATTTNFFATTASSTNLFAAIAHFGSMILDTALSIASGGTGTSTAPSYGQVLVGNASGGYDLVATSSLGIVSGAGSSFSTTSADYWKSVNDFFSTTSAAYFADASTTIAKTYSNNIFTALQQFQNLTFLNATGTAATTTSFFASVASSTNLFAAAGTLGSLSGAGLVTCDSSTAKLLWSGGLFSCGTDLNTGGGGGSDVNWTYFNGSGIQVATTSNQVLVGAASTSTLSKLEVHGGATIDTSTTTAATTTNLFATTASSTNLFSAAAQVGSLAIANLSGFLKATAGAVSTALVNLASDVTGILGVANGGTGWANIEANTLLTGNGSGALATTTVGTGLTLSGGTLSNSGVLSLAQSSGSAQTGALTLATSTQSFNGLTLGTSITNSGGTFTFTPSTSGTLNNSGLTNSTISGIALGQNLADLTATDSTLTFSGSYNGSTARTVGINLANANTWSALQQFGAGASTTQLSVTQQAYFGATATSSFSSAGVLNLAGLTSTLLKTDGSNNVVAAVAGTDYLNPATGVTSVAQSFGTGQHGDIILATSTLSFNGLTLGTKITNSSGTFTLTPTSAGTLDNSGLTNSTIALTSSDSSLSVSGSPASLGGSLTATLNTAHANTFTALQQFAAASTTLLSSYGPSYFGATATSTFDSAGFLTLAAGLLAQGSSTLQNFTFNLATGTAATTTSFFASVASSTSLFAASGTLGSLSGAGLTTCNNTTDKLQWVGGAFSCGIDQTGGGGGTSTDWNFFNNSGVRLTTTTNQVLIGASATTTLAALEVAGSIESYATGNPTLASSTPSADVTYQTAIAGNLAYSAEGTGGLRIKEVTNPKNPYAVGSFALGNALSVAVAGRYAYVGDETTGLNIIDVSNPASPVRVGNYKFSETNPFFAYGLVVSGKYVFMTDFNNDSVQILDVGNPQAPVLVATYTVSSGSPYGLAVSGKYLYVTEPGINKVHILDISNPPSPTLVGAYSLAGSNPFGVYASGKYLYVADAVKGFYILNVSNPASPVQVGQYKPDVSDAYYGVSAAGNYAYVADHGHLKTLVIDTSDPTAPALVGAYTAASGAPMAVTLGGKYAYMADYDGGLQIVSINGLRAPSASIGSLAADQLNVSDNVAVGGDITAGGGLNVGISGIFSRGTIAAFIASTTQSNPTVASFVGGNVGIGTTSPYARLTIAANSTDPNKQTTLFAIASSTSAFATSTLFNISNTGAVGIATTSGPGKLNILSANATAAEFLSGASNAFTMLSLGRTTSEGQIGIAGGAGQFISNSSAGDFTFKNFTGGSLLFGSGSNPASMLSVTSGGVGVGTTTPNAKLDVNGTLLVHGTNTNGAPATPLAALELFVGRDNTGALLSGQTVADVAFDYGGAGGGFRHFIATKHNATADTGNALEFFINTSGTAAGSSAPGTGNVRVLGLYGNGDVGIGTSSPYAKLSVAAGTSGTVIAADAASGFSGKLLDLKVASTTKLSINQTGVVDLSPTAQTGDKLFTFNGQNFLSATTSSTGTLTLGYQAGQAILASSGTAGNTAFGYQALTLATSSIGDTAVGYQALKSEIVASTANTYNTAVGYEALQLNTTGTQNTALGAFALLRNTTGTNNLALGQTTLENNTTGDQNVANGTNAFDQNTTGSDNAALGYQAAFKNITGSQNVAIGSQVLFGNTSATGTVAIGYQAAAGNFTAYNSQGGVYIGYQAGYPVQSSSDYNVAIGYQAARNLTTGANNVLLGGYSSSGNSNLTSGSGNISLGYNISLPSATANNQLNIQNILYGTGNSGTGSTLSTGKLGVATTTPWARFSVDTSSLAASVPSFAVGSSTRTDLVVTQAGNVGIGTSTPNSTYKLDVFGSYARISSTGGTDAAWGSNVGSNTVFSGLLGVSGCGTSNWAVYNGGCRLVADSSGNVGIGTSTPALFTGSSSGFLDISAATNPGVVFENTTSNSQWITFNSAGKYFINTLGTGGGNKFSILSTGEVGVGSTTPWAQLSVNPNGVSGPEFAVGSSTKTDFVITNAGNVGIGTTTPSRPLDVYSPTFGITGVFASGAGGAALALGGSANTGFFQAYTNDSLTTTNNLAINPSGGNIAIGTTTAFVGDAAIASLFDTTLNIHGNNSKTAGGSLTLSSNNAASGAVPGAIEFYVSGISAADQRSGYIGSQLTAAAGSTVSGSLLFGTNNAGTAATRMTIDAAGNVGIGTTGPTQKLQVVGGTFGVFNSASTGGLSVDGAAQTGVTSVYSDFLGGSEPKLHLSSFSGRASAAGITIDTSGNVGIGTTSPGRLLDVYSAASDATARLQTGTAGKDAQLTLDRFSNTASRSEVLFDTNGAIDWAVGTLNAGVGVANSAFSIATGGTNLSNSKFLVDSSGNVGIGTTSPTKLLSLAVSTVGGGISLDGTGTNSPSLSLTGNLGNTGSSTLALALSAGHFSSDATAGDVVLRDGGNDIIFSTESSHSFAADLIIKSGGNVGIGTSTPFSTLSVQNNYNSGNTTLFTVASSTSSTNATAVNFFSVDSTGLASVGNSAGTGDASAQFAGDTNAWSIGYATTDKSFRIASSTNLSANVALTIQKSNLNVGIGTTSPETTLTVVGAICAARAQGVQTSACGTTAGGIYANTSSLSSGSDVAETYQTIDPTLSAGEIVTFDPANKEFIMRAAPGATTLGVVATAPALMLGETSSTTRYMALAGRVPTRVSLEGGYIAVGDRIALSSVSGVGRKARPGEPTLGVALESLATSTATSSIIVFVNPAPGIDFAAIGEALLASTTTATSTASSTPQATAPGFFSSLMSKLTAWFASAGNGIVDLFAAHIHAQIVDADTVNTKTLCIGATCVTETQLQQLLNGQTAAAAAFGAIATTSAPILSVNGNNPASIAVGTIYSDLGATIVGPAADLNLGIMASVDGGEPRTIDQISIDTSVPGTHTIIYSATDQNGVIGSAQRTVVVFDASAAPTTQATSTPPVIDTGTASSTSPIIDASTATSTNATSTTP